MPATIHIPITERQMGLVAITLNGHDQGYRLGQRLLVVTDPGRIFSLLRDLDRPVPDDADAEAARKLRIAIEGALGLR